MTALFRAIKLWCFIFVTWAAQSFLYSFWLLCFRLTEDFWLCSFHCMFCCNRLPAVRLLIRGWQQKCFSRLVSRLASPYVNASRLSRLALPGPGESLETRAIPFPTRWGSQGQGLFTGSGVCGYWVSPSSEGRTLCKRTGLGEPPKRDHSHLLREHVPHLDQLIKDIY